MGVIMGLGSALDEFKKKIFDFFLGDYLKKIEDIIKSSNQSEFSQIKNDIFAIKKQLGVDGDDLSFNSKMVQKEEEILTLNKEIQELKDRLEELRSEKLSSEKKGSKLADLERKIDKISEERDDFQKKVQKLESDKSTLEFENDKLKTVLKTSEAESKQLKNSYSELEKDLSNLKNSLNNSQNIEKNLKQDLNRLELKNRDLESENSQLSQKISEESEKFSKVKTTVDKHRDILSKIVNCPTLKNFTEESGLSKDLENFKNYETLLKFLGKEFYLAKKIQISIEKEKQSNLTPITKEEQELYDELNSYYKKENIVFFDVFYSPKSEKFEKVLMRDSKDPRGDFSKWSEIYFPAIQEKEGTFTFKALVKGVK